MTVEKKKRSPGSRDVGRRFLLATLEAMGPATRAELAEATGMSVSTVSSLARSLAADGVVAESTLPRSTVGRPSTLLSMSPVSGSVLGIDLGHSHLTVAVGTAKGDIIARAHELIDGDEPAPATLRRITAIAAELLDGSGPTPSELLSVALGVPAPVDSTSGRISSNNILPGWVDFAPARELTRLLGVPVALENDANLGALGESAQGAARGVDNFIFVKVSTGIGAGLYLNGEIYHGGRGSAGEIGHLQVRPDGNLCRCGSRGCLETEVSLPHIVDSLQPAYDVPVTLEYIRQLLAEDDAGAARVLTDLGVAIGSQLAGLCTVLNPTAIVVGGQIGTLSSHVTAGIRTAISRSTQPFAAKGLSVIRSELGEDAEIIGAVHLAAAGTRRRSSSRAPRNARDPAEVLVTNGPS